MAAASARVAVGIALATLVAGSSAGAAGAGQSGGALPFAGPSSSGGAEPDVAQFVSPFIGTAPAAPARGERAGVPRGGNTFPGATLPFGMLQWSPETRNGFDPRHGQTGGYAYPDQSIRTFSLRHASGAPCPMLGDVGFMPVVGPVARSPALAPDETSATFSHLGEQAVPGSYGVTLLSSRIRADLTVTTRTGLGRFTFPNVRDATIVLDVGGGAAASAAGGGFDGFVQVVGNQRVVGSTTTGGLCGGGDRHTVYFAAEFERPFARFGTWSGASLAAGARVATGRRVGAFFTFDASRQETVLVKVGLSYVGVENAWRNLKTESPGWRFSEVRDRARATWNQTLGRAQIDGASAAQKQIFYTALYHALLHPNVLSDVDGQYVGLDRRVHVADGYRAYGGVAGPALYRAQAALLALLFPREASDVARSLLDAAEQAGAAPRWSVANTETGVGAGDPAAVVIATLQAFGASGVPVRRVLGRLVEAADRPGLRGAAGEVRPGLGPYLARGFVPAAPELGGAAASAATTLEYAVADFAIAQLASAAGDRSLHARMMKRAQAWQLLFDGGTGALAARRGDGVLIRPFVLPHEAAARSWAVPHDLAGLIEAVGGRRAALARLDAAFGELKPGAELRGVYADEQALSGPYAYVFAGAPWRAQEAIRRLLALYNEGPAGLPGPDALGALSAWYVWAALGLHPAVPGVGGVIVGAPLFAQARLRLGNGRVVTLSAPAASPAAPFLHDLRVDGRPWSSAWLPLDRLLAATSVELTVGAAPNLSFGARAEQAPPSFREGERRAIPFVARSFFPVLRGGAARLVLDARGLGGQAIAAARWFVEPPHPLVASPTGGLVGQGVAISVSAPPQTPRGCYVVPLGLEIEGAPPAAVELSVSDDPLSLHYGARGISADAAPGDADFDGQGHSYSAEALRESGLTPGDLVDGEGGPVVWPNACALDHVVADGQTITLPAATRARRLVALGAAEGSPEGGAGVVTITYADGARVRAALGFDDWTLAGGAVRPTFGNAVVAAMPYHNGRGGRVAVKTYVYQATVALDPDKAVKSVVLPSAKGTRPARLRLFGMAFAR